MEQCRDLIEAGYSCRKFSWCRLSLGYIVLLIIIQTGNSLCLAYYINEQEGDP